MLSKYNLSINQKLIFIKIRAIIMFPLLGRGWEKGMGGVELSPRGAMGYVRGPLITERREE